MYLWYFLLVFLFSNVLDLITQIQLIETEYLLFVSRNNFAWIDKDLVSEQGQAGRDL